MSDLLVDVICLSSNCLNLSKDERFPFVRFNLPQMDTLENTFTHGYPFLVVGSGTKPEGNYSLGDQGVFFLVGTRLVWFSNDCRSYFWGPGPYSNLVTYPDALLPVPITVGKKRYGYQVLYIVPSPYYRYYQNGKTPGSTGL